ncbi:MAG: YXWGXW repeat-containing protein [Candidatus Aminicenantes bacterium]|nr:YXWGXW repeat-containing protein [Candidatus Aminicenantes bacterium]
MKKIAWILLVSIIFVFIASCVVARPTVAPPPAKREVVRAKPGQSYVWISGHWKWTGSRYVWAPGHWEKGRKNHIWVPGHWEKRGRHWVYIKGHWKRR